ncbi:hypothetical protein K470DRAFT_266495 [Piedraia hortae CBS 480.64]|uniref:Uncharacterized protein n=1 Tax=Piedraia hortae CBS 480.64 TaxID=1314780 RepID=A0A6A7BRN6_9PEZI|nr:hypothetical protein K470DRAFT_266495 [Piedraia hortae CBS 480.64]
MYTISCIGLGENHFFISLYDLTCLLGFLQHGNPHVFSISGIWSYLKSAEPMPGYDPRFSNWYLSEMALMMQMNKCLPNDYVPMGYDFMSWGDLQVFLEKGFNVFELLRGCVRRVDPQDLSFRGSWVPTGATLQGQFNGGLVPQGQQGDGGANDSVGNQQRQLPRPSLGGVLIPPWPGPSYGHDEDGYGVNGQQRIPGVRSLFSCNFDDDMTAGGHGAENVGGQRLQTPTKPKNGDDDITDSRSEQLRTPNS